ncbi:uncharacterized protein LOC143547068 [Bidens hawaiensis]|uniref:uncharacterized protein LOC143547068 n=1 Tax=Bidens hawaiensis TaxID=980011 RepID=UPI0040494072
MIECLHLLFLKCFEPPTPALWSQRRSLLRMLVVLEFNIFASTDEAVLTKISSTLGIYRPQDGEAVLVQFWAAKKIKNVYVLTTTDQPFRLHGNKKELQQQYQADLDRKHYVFRDATAEAAFGLAGRVFLYCTPAQTHDVHTYDTQGHCTPRCKYAICAKMGSFAVPVIDANNCVGALGFVMDTLRDYSNDILAVQGVLQHVGLQTSNSIQWDGTKRTYICPEVRRRTTYTSPVTWYCCLAPLFGLSSVDARIILSKLTGRKIGESTFANIRKNVGIPEWPYIRKTKFRASYVPETQINGTVSEANSFIGDPIAELNSNRFLESPDSMAGFGGMTYQDNNSPVMYPDSMDDENSVNIDLPNANMMSIEVNEFPAYFGGLNNQANIVPMCLDPMDNENSVTIDHPGADMISIPDCGLSEQTVTSDVEPGIESGYFSPDFMPGTHGMECQSYNPSVLEDLDEGSNVSEEIYMGSTLWS